jgi:hypothetical protein
VQNRDNPTLYPTTARGCDPYSQLEFLRIKVYAGDAPVAFSRDEYVKTCQRKPPFFAGFVAASARSAKMLPGNAAVRGLCLHQRELVGIFWRLYCSRDTTKTTGVL